MYTNQTKIADLPILTENEQQLLESWNDTRQVFPLNACIPQLIANQAKTAPDAIALVSKQEVLEYRELNQRANQLAHYLQTLGVGPNVLVGVCVERSLDMVIGLLGVLKAGGAYVPLDPTYPPERLSYMLEDAHTPVLVTWQSIAERLPTGETKLVCLDRDWEVLAQQSSNDPETTISPEDLAYVIYTSGSTGRPKGVQITHRSLLNLVFWHQCAYAVTSSERATQLTSPAFDATGWEIWPYLTIGARVYLLDEETRVNPSLLRDKLVQLGITITFLPTPLAESVLTLDWSSNTSLRLLLTGADKLQHYPPPNLPFALINNYGPTEATVVATFGRVFPTEHVDAAPSIGRPIANTQIYILDDNLRQVPIGVAGELYIAGVGVARGYLNRPKLTAERFIPDPFSDSPAARMYKTGDIARYLTDGQIAFLGRADHQIKIRGYRIEPDEIIAVLNRHPSIQASIVVAHEDGFGDKRLVAYIVVAPGTQITAAELREMLSTYLPDYMIPASFIVLETLPETSNGKIDRAALPAPESTNTLQDEVFVRPTTPAEERIAHIVTTLLKLDQVSIDDNFFMLGGHSLLGTQIIAQVSETFGVDLPLRSLFESPTIRLLAAEIERRIIANLETMSETETLRLLDKNAKSGRTS